MAFLADAVLDGGLDVLTNNVTTLWICSTEPATYAEASSTYALGSKTSYTVGAATNGDTSGRKVVAPAVTDGSVSADGTAGYWALTSADTLYAANSLSSSQGVTNGNTFTLAAFDITFPDATSA